MLTSNKVSLKNIIAKVYRDLGIQEEESFIDIIEWAAEALGLIGVHDQFEAIEDCINICNHKAEIPCGLIYLDDVNYKGIQLNKGSGGNVFPEATHRMYNTSPAVNKEKMMNIPFKLGYRYQFDNNETFIMENGWFKTSFREGNILIKYRKLSVDDEGIPLVPDTESFRAAIFWYIAMKYFFVKSIIEDRFTRFYKEAEEKWHWYCNQAGANAMMPDLHMMENIKKNYLQLLPKVYSYKVFFSDLNRSI